MTHQQTTLAYTLLITHKTHTHTQTTKTHIIIENQNIDKKSMNQKKMDRLQTLEILEVGRQRIERKHGQTMGIGHKNNQKKIDIKH